MANKGKSKQKLLYLLQIFEQETDAERGLTMGQLIDRLSEYGIDAERKSIYEDIKVLNEFGKAIEKLPTRPPQYALTQRGFSTGDFMLMIDAVQSCKAISEKQAKMLETNIKQLASNRIQEKLRKTIHVAGRIKSKSDSVLPTVDAIHRAISERKQIVFNYNTTSVDKGKIVSKVQEERVATPVLVAYDSDFYYLSAWEEKKQEMREFRIDRMSDVRIIEDDETRATENTEIRKFRDEEGKITKFGRFANDEDIVLAKLLVSSDKISIVMDRFGRQCEKKKLVPYSDEQVTIEVRLYKSDQFFGWVASMGGEVQIAGPESLVEEYQSYLEARLEEEKKFLQE